MTKKQTPWTRFMDLHSGGGLKEEVQYIYIQAPQAEAEVIFYNRFGHNPNRVSCTCCGPDYSIAEHTNLAQATGYDRNCEFVWFDPQGNEVPQEKAWVRGKGVKKGYTSGYAERERAKFKSFASSEYVPLSAFLDDPKKYGSMLIYDADIKPEERTGTLPAQGYVWMG